MEEIIQIIPAPSNMFVRLWQGENEQAEYGKIVCLALIKDFDGLTYVTPMTLLEEEGTIENVHDFSNFGGIVWSENPENVEEIRNED